MTRITAHISRRLMLIAWPAFVLFLVLLSWAANEECALRHRAHAGACPIEAARVVASVPAVADMDGREGRLERTALRHVPQPPQRIEHPQIRTLVLAPKTSPPA